MNQCIHLLGDAAVFTTLDGNSGYWQIEIAKADRRKSTFTSRFGLFRFIWMSFGLKYAPATFRRAVDTILFRSEWKIVLVYLEDVAIYSRIVTECLTHAAEVLQLLPTRG